MFEAPLYLCRHGQTDWNAGGRLQGQVDVPLNALGRSQAARNGRTLAALLGSQVAEFRFLASPMSRTVETMRIIRTAMDLDPDGFETDERLIELHFGDWQGSTLSDVEAVDPEAIAARERGKWGYVPPGPGAESYDMLSRRVAPVFEALSGPTVMVAHGGTARSLLKLSGELGPDDAAHWIIPQDRMIRMIEGRIEWV